MVAFAEPRRPPRRAYAPQCVGSSSCANRLDQPLPRNDRNQQYSIIALTNGGGSIVERYAYTAYGQPTIFDSSLSLLATSNSGNRYTYTGREWDDTLDLYHYRARIYDAVAGRFVARDPIGYEDSSSLYQYVQGNPTAFFDPFGFQTVVSMPQSSEGPRQPYQPTDPLKPGWPTPTNPFAPPKPNRDFSPCEGYSATIGSTCKRGNCYKLFDIPDPYPVKAQGICREFLKMYEFSPKVKCVANCLGGAEKELIGSSMCETRNKKRLENHVACYARCRFIPWLGLPDGAEEVGWEDLLPDYYLW